MEKLDLFNTLVRFLAIKPLRFDQFDFNQAQELIKDDRKGAITFMGDHGDFEGTLEGIAKQVGDSKIAHGTFYLFVKGNGCTARMERNLLNILMSVQNMYIFGDPAAWPIHDSKIKFVNPEGIFEDNHQRFLIFQSPAYNVALVARHHEHNSEEMVEAAMTNAQDAVSLLSQSIGTKIYGNLEN